MTKKKRSIGDLYKEQERDEKKTDFSDLSGFSLIRFYPKHTKYFEDGMRIFIQVKKSGTDFFYSADMTKPEKRGENIEYVIVDGSKYKNKITNFISDGDDYVFNEQKDKVVFKKTEKEFTLNEFVDMIEANHLRDCLFVKRFFNFFLLRFLKIIFWLSDRHYETLIIRNDRIFGSRNLENISGEKYNSEPFFKYFKISNNLFLIVLILFSVIIILFRGFLSCSLGEMSLSNPLIILLFFIGLFFSEKFSTFLNNKIDDFLKLNSKKNFIEKLHNFYYINKFNMKDKFKNLS